jgi:hypothetical protein
MRSAVGRQSEPRTSACGVRLTAAVRRRYKGKMMKRELIVGLRTAGAAE